MKRGLILAVLCAGFMLCSSAFAETSFKGGVTERMRHEFWKNIFDMNNDVIDNINFFRFKTSLWGQAEFGEDKDLGLYIKMTNENRAYAYRANSTTGNKDFHYDINEMVFDNLYADAKDIFGLPVDIRFGRQDFLGTYGEGFLIMDGTPQDGSRTFYFNAVKTTWRMNDENAFDFIYTRNPRDDTYLPVINEDKSPQALNTTAEEGYILYWKNKHFKDLALEGYYIFKREDDDGGAGLQGQKGIINTFGSFAKYNFSQFALRTQLAYQFGDYGNNDRTGLGGYVFVDKAFKDAKWSPAASLGFVYLSGDKRKSGKNEAWDPLFSRWPWLSELYVSSYATEAGVAGYWTNLQAWRAEFSVKPTEKIKFTVWYNFLRANEQVAATANTFSSSGKDRGHLPQVRLDYLINKNISTYILAEYFIPGNFYVDARDGSVFLRTEVQLKF